MLSIRSDDPPLGLSHHLAGRAHVGGNQRVSTGLARYQAFLSWVQSEGLPLDPDLIVFSDTFQEEAGRRALAGLLRSHGSPGGSLTRHSSGALWVPP
jgi:DNA-binding LacI/PurR family transcriptional regulator